MRFHPAASTTPTGAAKAQSKTGPRPAVARGQNRQTIYVLDGGQLKPSRVQLGITDGNYTEILGGLNEGQLVVTGTASKTNPAPPSQANSGKRFGF
jgi:hypothetical protein